jgi:Major capsid protein Gp23
MMILSIIFYIAIVALTCYLGDKYAKHLQKKITQRNNSGLLLSLVRRIMPTMIAHDLVGVQPMDKPAGNIFAMRCTYGAMRYPYAPQQLEFDFTEKEPVQLEFEFMNPEEMLEDMLDDYSFPIRYIPNNLEDEALKKKYKVHSDPDGGIIAALKRVSKDLPTN